MITGVKVVNFLSFESLEVNFTGGVTLIDGFNEDDQTSEGSGKSSIFNAICWGLFGKIPKDANIDDVIKHGEKSCGVAVIFPNALIRRTRNPNELSLEVEGKVIKGKDARETQQLIEDFIGLTFETFCQTVYFAQNYAKKFITANQEEKGKILSEIQNLSVFDRAGKEVRELIKFNEVDITKLKHSHDMGAKDAEILLRDISAERVRHVRAREQQEQRIQNLTTQISAEEGNRQRELDNQVRRIADLNVHISDAEQVVAEHEISHSRMLEVSVSLVFDEVFEQGLLDANNLLMRDYGALNAEISGIDKLISKRESAERQGGLYANRYKAIQAEREKNRAFISNPTKNCPTCGSRLEACDTSHALVEIDKLESEISEITKLLTELSEEIDAPIPTKDELNARMADIRQQRSRNELEIKNLRAIKDKRDSSKAHLQALENNIREQQDRIRKFLVAFERENLPLLFDDARLNTLRRQLDAESQPLNLDKTALNDLMNKLAVVQSNAANFENLISKKTEHLSRLESLKSGFREVKSHVFNSLLNEVNGRVQRYLLQLFEVPVVVRFTNEDMKIETKVKYDGVERGLGLLSGGQFRRVSLAVDLALSDVITARKGAVLGITIWDEYLKDLSEQSMEKVVRLFESRNQPTLIIEHNSIIKTLATNSIFVKLENGTSRVETHIN